MEQLNTHIIDCLNRRTPFAVVTIMTHKGSTPRTSGSKMIVLKDRTIFGTVGGGLVEALTIDASIELIDKNKCLIKEFSLNQKLKDGLDMVCGGDLTVFIETFDTNSKQNANNTAQLLSVFTAVDKIQKKSKKGFLISKINGFSKAEFITQKYFARSDGSVSGNGILPDSIIKAIQDNQFSSTSPFLFNHALEEFIIEPILPQDIVYIFGAGHVGYQLAKMAHLTDFQVVITDDREEFSNCERFPKAKEVRVIKNFKSAFDDLHIDNQSYIVILTRGHLYDQAVLEAALKTKPAYIGMIGSSGKRKQIYSNLMEKGFSKETLETIYSPIGIEINSETPAEIAVSIIGQIIKIRADK